MGAGRNLMNRVTALIFLILLAYGAPARSAVEEILVTGSYVESEMPGTHLRRQGDNLLLKIRILNDSRDEAQREQEIYESLRAALEAAEREDSIELSTVSDSGFVSPLTEANHRIDLADGDRPDTSTAFFRAKSPISSSDQDGEALVRKLKRFVEALTPTGRTEFIVEGDVEVSIVEPDQYRSDVIRIFTDDVKAVTSALGHEYRVVVRGLDRPIQWLRAGGLEVAIFIPYTYDIVPTSINAYSAPESY